MRVWPALLIVLALGSAVGVLLNTLTLDQRINVFLPQPKDPQQALVIDQIQSSPGAEPQQLADRSRKIAELWRSLPGVQRVENGTEQLDSATEERLMQMRFLMLDDIPQRLTIPSMHEQLSQRLSDISLLGAQLDPWIGRDPLGLLPDLSTQLASAQAPRKLAGVWFDIKGERAMLLVMSEHTAYDSQAQAALVADLRQQFSALNDSVKLNLELAGAPVIAVNSATTARQDAVQLTIAGSLFLVLALLWFWRSATLLIVAAIPLGVGICCGLLITVTAFDQVHALTLAFGFTLLGVALDYPIHLIVHARARGFQEAAHEIMQPLLLSSASTVIAYLVIWYSTSPGLAQLGAFSAAGLVGATAATWLLPKFCHALPTQPQGQSMRTFYVPWVAPLLAGMALLALYLQGDKLWSSDLTRLTPVNAEMMALDQSLRKALATGDTRYMLVITATDLEPLLISTEATVEDLEQARKAGFLAGWQAITSIIPSQRTQSQRRADWPDPAHIKSQLNQASEAFKPEAFQPFIDDLAALDQQPNIGPDTWQGTLLQLRVDSLLKFSDQRWHSIIIPAGLSDTEGLRQFLRAVGSGGQLVDLKATSETMVSAYRHEASISLGIAAVLIAMLLWLRLRDPGLTLRVLIPPVAAVLCTALIMSWLDHGLTIVHLIGLLLASSIGLDYAIFSMTLNKTREQGKDTNRSINLCALSSGGVFLILGQSDIGMLNMLGLTVAVGILFSWVFSRLMQKSGHLN